jgi:hypothetical protein
MDEIVSLEQAWFWQCPRCQKGNYARSVAADMTEVPEDTVREMLGLESWQEIPADIGCQFVTAPEFVKCAHCSAEFPCFVDDDDDDGPPSSGDDPEVPEGVPEDFGTEPG